MMRRQTWIGWMLVLALAPAWADYADERQALLDRETELAEPGSALSETERFEALTALYFDWTLLEAPEFGTYIGSPKHQDRWTDISRLAQRRREADTRRALAILEGIDRAALSEDDRFNYDLFLASIRQDVDGQRFFNDEMPITQLSGVHQDVAQILSLMPARSVADYRNILARLDGVEPLIDDTLVWLQRGLEVGATPPKVTLREVPQQILNQIPETAADSPMLAPFQQMPGSVPADQQALLKQRAEAIYSSEIRPAFQRLHEFFAELYLPRARESIAMSALPDGEAWYAYNVKARTTTDLTPQQIHDIGLAEVRRIRGEMTAVMREAGHDGDFASFFEFLRSDPQFYFDTPEALLRAYRDIAKRADPELVKLFGHLPRTPYGVVAVPAYAEKSQTTAYYQPGSLAAGRPGNYFANTYALDTRPSWEMEALTLHEAVPGHHLQIAIQQELGELPWYRRYGWGYTAFVEGWGLYAESLGEDMGFYADPYSKFGALTYEMWRAVRLVVDTGMHALGWSREQAIQFFKDNAGKTEHDIVVEIDRYIVWPGQALAYKIGQLRIQALRDQAQAELGEDFDIRAFHDRVLGAGAMPLDLLEARIQTWVDEQRAED